MRLTFLGTAAAEGFPGIFCDCARCNEARALGGKNLRFRSALLVNEDLLIDFGPDLLAAAIRFDLNLSKVTTGLVTHAHQDHFYLGNFFMRKKDFTGGEAIPTMQLYGPPDAIKELKELTPDLKDLRVEAHVVKAFDAWENGGYQFTAFEAYHGVGYLEPLFYSVTDEEGSAFLYATDTGPFTEATWKALRGRAFDVIILEETMGEGTYDQHLGFETFTAHAERMKAEGMLKPGGRLIATHLSHSGNPTHEKVGAALGPGVEVAYDGMRVEL